jgi:hypothetical protein
LSYKLYCGAGKYLPSAPSPKNFTNAFYTECNITAKDIIDTDMPSRWKSHINVYPVTILATLPVRMNVSC